MEFNGTTYADDTPQAVIDVLERARQNGTRVRVHYGDTGNGADWGDTCDVAGTIGRSTGSKKIPLLIPNARSTGGAGVLTRHIVRIRYANRAQGGDLYRHPGYHVPDEVLEYLRPNTARRHFA